MATEQYSSQIELRFSEEEMELMNRRGLSVQDIGVEAVKKEMDDCLYDQRQVGRRDTEGTTFGKQQCGIRLEANNARLDQLKVSCDDIHCALRPQVLPIQKAAGRITSRLNHIVSTERVLAKAQKEFETS